MFFTPLNLIIAFSYRSLLNSIEYIRLKSALITSTISP